MVKPLTEDNFIDTLFESPVGTIEETHAQFKIRIPIKERQDLEQLKHQILKNQELREQLEGKK